MPTQETLKHPKPGQPQSLVGSLGPGAHKVLTVPFRSLFPQSCESSVIKSHWPSKSNSLGGSQSLCQIPRLGNLLWALELLQQCENFFGITVLQFVGCLLGGSMVGLTHHTSQVCCSQSPSLCGRPLLTRASTRGAQTLKDRSGSVSCGKFLKSWEYQTTLPASWETCMQVKKQQLEPDMEQWTGSKLGKEYVKAVYRHPAYLTYMQSTS